MLVLDGGDVVVRLTRLEKVGAFHGDVRVPRAAIESARVATQPLKELRGLRAPGTAWPKPLVALGTWRRRRARPDFLALHGRGDVVVIELNDQSPKFGRLLVTVADGDNVIAELGLVPGRS
jgi:hypothetical protein